MDDTKALRKGPWTEGTGLAGFIGRHYLYSSNGSGGTIHFKFKVTGRHEIRLAYRAHENRGTSVPVTVRSAGGEKSLRLDMRKKPPVKHGFVSLGVYEFRKGEAGSVTVSTRGAGGIVCVDALQILPAK